MKYEAAGTAPIACDSLFTSNKHWHVIDIPSLALSLAYHTLHQGELPYHTPKSNVLADHHSKPPFLSLYVQLGIFFFLDFEYSPKAVLRLESPAFATTGRQLCHWECLWKWYRDLGTFLSYFVSQWSWGEQLCITTNPQMWFSDLPLIQRNRPTWLRTKDSKITSQNKSFFLISYLFCVFCYRLVNFNALEIYTYI